MDSIVVLAAHWQQHLPNGNSSTDTLWLSKGTPHSCLKPISPSTWKHLVDPEHMERMNSHSQVKRILASKLSHILVAGNAGSLKCLAWYILFLPTDQVHTEGEFVYSLLLHAHIIDANLWVWHTPAESGLRVWFVLDLPVTPCWACQRSHQISWFINSKGRQQQKQQPSTRSIDLFFSKSYEEWQHQKLTMKTRCRGTKHRSQHKNSMTDLRHVTHVVWLAKHQNKWKWLQRKIYPKKKRKKKPGKKKSCISSSQTKRKIQQMHIYASHEQEACIHRRRTPKEEEEEEDSFNEKQIQALRTIYKAWRRPSSL